jgi:enamine deaminase RidA (YjgF/YER057c/UK114 family)
MIVPAGPTLYVGGQNGTDDTGTMLEGLEAQTKQAIGTWWLCLRRPVLILSMLPK